FHLRHVVPSGGARARRRVRGCLCPHARRWAWGGAIGAERFWVLGAGCWVLFGVRGVWVQGSWGSVQTVSSTRHGGCGYPPQQARRLGCRPPLPRGVQGAWTDLRASARRRRATTLV